MKKQPKHSHISNTKIDDEVVVRKRKKRKVKKAHPKRKVVLIIFGVIIAIILMALAAFKISQEIGKNNLKTEYNEGKYVEYNGNKYQYNENVVSTLIIGQDQEDDDEYEGHAGQADFILLMTLDTESGRMKGISIPRDTMVEIGEYFGGLAQQQGNNGHIQLCLAYGYGDGGQRSCENMVKAVSRLLYNVPVNYYLALNMEGIAPMNDSIGGVTLTPIENIPKTPIVKGEKITLLGNNAKSYVRYRYKVDPQSSEQRRARQVQYIQEFYKQAFKSSNGIGVAMDLFNKANNYSVTNLGLTEFSYLAGVVLQNGISKFDISAVDGQLTRGEKYIEIWPNQQKLYELVLDTFFIKIDDCNEQ